MSAAARVLERCDRLAQVSEEADRLTRRFGTDAMREANELVGSWMREAGLAVREDALRNLIGRRGDGPALMLGSHLDTVVGAGRYDGPLGVLVAIEAAERVPRALEVVAFADEEGVRFGTAYLGSSAMTGRFDPAWRDLRDDDGIRLGDLVGGPGPARAAGRGCSTPPGVSCGTATCGSATSSAMSDPRGTTCSATSRSTSSRGRCSSGSASRSAS